MEDNNLKLVKFSLLCFYHKTLDLVLNNPVCFYSMEMAKAVLGKKNVSLFSTSV